MMRGDLDDKVTEPSTCSSPHADPSGGLIGMFWGFESLIASGVNHDESSSGEGRSVNTHTEESVSLL